MEYENGKIYSVKPILKRFRVKTYVCKKQVRANAQVSAQCKFAVLRLGCQYFTVKTKKLKFFLKIN